MKKYFMAAIFAAAPACFSAAGSSLEGQEKVEGEIVEVVEVVGEDASARSNAKNTVALLKQAKKTIEVPYKMPQDFDMMQKNKAKPRFERLQSYIDMLEQALKEIDSLSGMDIDIFLVAWSKKSYINGSYFNTDLYVLELYIHTGILPDIYPTIEPRNFLPSKYFLWPKASLSDEEIKQLQNRKVKFIEDTTNFLRSVKPRFEAVRLELADKLR